MSFKRAIDQVLNQWGKIVLPALALFWVLTGAAQAQEWEITGVVTDSSGQGIQNVNIDLFTQGGNEIILSMDFTLADGTFTFIILDNIAAGFFDIAYEPAAGSHFFKKTVEDVFLSGNTDVGTIVLDSGWYVSGVVVDESGTGLPDVDLEFFDQVGNPIPLSGDITDAGGNFQVLVQPDTYDIEFRVTPGTPGGPYV
ncbi:MAG: carboxypeptidase-like regulatory domain-containing protein, partial [Planctomycetota bacterium]